MPRLLTTGKCVGGEEPFYASISIVIPDLCKTKAASPCLPRKEQITRLKKEIVIADAVVIGAGAGLSANLRFHGRSGRGIFISTAI